MKRIKSLSTFQKAVLLIAAAMALVFTVLCPAIVSRKGFAYRSAILVPHEESGDTVYAGRVRGKEAAFTVSPDKTTVFRYGDTTYGPYSFREDPSAVPKDAGYGRAATGVELRRGEEVLFRGYRLITDSGNRWLFNEDGSVEETSVVSFTTNDGSTTIDADGNVVDPMEPTALDLVELMTGPELTHKGNMGAWAIGILFCLLAALEVLFADELFRWRMSFRIQNAERAEPSDWEIMSRHIAWAVLLIAALVIFILGLR